MYLSYLPHTCPNHLMVLRLAHLMMGNTQVMKLPYKTCGVAFTTCDNGYLPFCVSLYEEKGFISEICYILLFQELRNLTSYNFVPNSETVV
jgi:hypothetical protein